MNLKRDGRHVEERATALDLGDAKVDKWWMSLGIWAVFAQKFKIYDSDGATIVIKLGKGKPSRISQKLLGVSVKAEAKDSLLAELRSRARRF